MDLPFSTLLIRVVYFLNQYRGIGAECMTDDVRRKEKVGKRKWGCFKDYY